MSTLIMEPENKTATEERSAFKPGLWTKEINVRDFILNNYTPYYEDESFLARPLGEPAAMWKKLQTCSSRS